MTDARSRTLTDRLTRNYAGAPGWLLVVVAAVLIVVGSIVLVRAVAGTGPVSRPARPVAVFLGDSYTAGVGASDAAKRWTSLLAAQAGWREKNLGRGGTGYVTTADVNGCGLEFCPAYSGEVQAAIDDDPDIVVIAGGQNDFSAWTSDSARVRAAITSLYRTVHRDLPGATIYAVGPSTTGAVVGPVVQMDAAVRQAAKSVGARYVSLISPDVIIRSMVLEDGGHVDDAGHRAIAQRVLSAVRAEEAA